MVFVKVDNNDDNNNSNRKIVVKEGLPSSSSSHSPLSLIMPLPPSTISTPASASASSFSSVSSSVWTTAYAKTAESFSLVSTSFKDRLRLLASLYCNNNNNREGQTTRAFRGGDLSRRGVKKNGIDIKTTAKPGDVMMTMTTTMTKAAIVIANTAVRTPVKTGEFDSDNNSLDEDDDERGKCNNVDDDDVVSSSYLFSSCFMTKVGVGTEGASGIGDVYGTGRSGGDGGGNIVGVGDAGCCNMIMTFGSIDIGDDEEEDQKENYLTLLDSFRASERKRKSGGRQRRRLLRSRHRRCHRDGDHDCLGRRRRHNRPRYQRNVIKKDVFEKTDAKQLADFGTGVALYFDILCWLTFIIFTAGLLSIHFTSDAPVNFGQKLS